MSLSKYLIGNAAAPPSDDPRWAAYGQRLDPFLRAMAEAGYPLQLYSNYRSSAKQKALFDAAVKKYGSPQATRKWVADPSDGDFPHGRGASDLSFNGRRLGTKGTEAATKLAHSLAPKYGLNFRMSHEPWHVEPAPDAAPKSQAEVTKKDLSNPAYFAQFRDAVPGMAKSFAPGAVAPFFRDEPTTAAGIPTAPQPFKPPTQQEIQSYIINSATQRGIDPKVALTVAQHEGLSADPSDGWRSTVVKDGKREHSYGVYQLLMEKDGKPMGVGYDMLRTTGLDPRDPRNWQQSIDYALNTAATNRSWGPWYGAQRAGLSRTEGLTDARPIQMASAATATTPPSDEYQPYFPPGAPAQPNLAGLAQGVVAALPDPSEPSPEELMRKFRRQLRQNLPRPTYQTMPTIVMNAPPAPTGEG